MRSRKTVLESRKTKTEKNTYIKTFRDLRVYQNLYRVQILVLEEIVPRLPLEEKYDLASQMRRACKAPPARIAEAFSQRYQKRQWGKSITDTIGECYEMINHLSVCIDVYHKYVNTKKCREAIEIYNISCAQLTKLKQNWQDFHERVGKR